MTYRRPPLTFLAQHRQRAGLSQERLAARAGISVAAIHRIEAGRTRPYSSTVIALAMALDMSYDEMYEPPDANAVDPATVGEV